MCLTDIYFTGKCKKSKKQEPLSLVIKANSASVWWLVFLLCKHVRKTQYKKKHQPLQCNHFRNRFLFLRCEHERMTRMKLKSKSRTLQTINNKNFVEKMVLAHNLFSHMECLINELTANQQKLNLWAIH